MLMLTRSGKRGKDESVNAWEMYEREHAGMPRRKLIIVAFWMEFEEYGLGPHAE